MGTFIISLIEAIAAAAAAILAAMALKRFVSSGCERVWVLDRDGLWGRGGLGGGADDADFCREACASFGVR